MIDKNLAPVCLFAYNRLKEIKITVNALQKNFLASESDLYIFSDGSKNESSKYNVNSVREFLKSVNGFKSITIFESKSNKGLADSIIDGVSQIINEFGKVIVVEDDLKTSPNFLDFMNQALHFYSEDDSVFSISGYTMDLKSLKKHNEDFYFGQRASSWGWGTWKKDWQSVDWKVNNYNSFKGSIKQQIAFNRGGSDMSSMLSAQMNGKIDSWAIRFCFQQFLNKQVCVFPKISKVQSIGFSKEATHTFGSFKFITELDNSNQTDFAFKEFNNYEKTILREFRAKFSIRQRIFDRLLRIIYVYNKTKK